MINFLLFVTLVLVALVSYAIWRNWQRAEEQAAYDLYRLQHDREQIRKANNATLSGRKVEWKFYPIDGEWKEVNK